eukprot:248524_1
MPVTPRFSWDQNDDSVEIVVEMYGVNKNSLKHFLQITPIFFSLNISPYLLQLDFENEINPFAIKVILMNKKETKFIFPKHIKKQQWNDLVSSKDKHIRLKERNQSIDELYQKQQQIREKRKKEKALRFKAAQQRQWDEQKYLKHIITKLENKEKVTSQNDLKQWIETENKTNTIANDDEKDVIQNEPEIRKSNVVQIGFSEWDYVTPVRNNMKPPEFARKSIISKYTNQESVSEVTPIFVCDRGIKYFLNKDYDSAINAFKEATNLDSNYLEAYCNRLQCYIQLKVEQNNDKYKSDTGGLLDDINKMESILQLLEDEETKQIINESISRHKPNVRTTANIIISFQKGILQTFMVLDALKGKEAVDDNTLMLIKIALDTGFKMFEINQKLNNLENDFGLFKDVNRIENLHQISKKCQSKIDVIGAKRAGDEWIRNKEYKQAIDKYSEAIGMIQTKDDDFEFLEYKCLNNRSAAYFSSKQYEECIEDCDTILSDHNDCKALIKRGGSYLSLWKSDKNNTNYLEKSWNDYKNAAQYDSEYQQYATQIENLLAQHLTK